MAVASSHRDVLHFGYGTAAALGPLDAIRPDTLIPSPQPSTKPGQVQPRKKDRTDD
jgi:hypothetical protein